MQFLPVKTRVMQPPQDDLFAVLEESLPELQEKDVVLISSKVVAIHEGKTLPLLGSDKSKLVQETSQMVIPRPYWNSPLTVAHHTFLGAAGIDESNGDGHLILLPKDLFLSAKNIRQWIKEKYQLSDIGVVIVDSCSAPFRFGATGISLSWWGIEPIEDCRGRADLFGREIRYERSNIVDGLAAGANVVMGEVDEATPVVIAREVPRLVFSEVDTQDQLLVPFEEDTFRVLYENFLPKKE